jgi:hypothetical protein
MGYLQALPAKEPGVYGPGARSEQCKSEPQDSRADPVPAIAWIRERTAERTKRSEHSGNGCPETREQEYSQSAGERMPERRSDR